MIDPIARLLGPWASELCTAAVLLRLCLSLVLSAVIGWERSSKRHSAGMRTFMLVGIASTTVMILDQLIHSQSERYPYLMSAAILLAIAILGMQSILFSSRNQVKGLTTIFGVLAWAVLGLTIGAGFYTAALLAFVALLSALTVLSSVEILLKKHSVHFMIHLELKNRTDLQLFVSTIRRLGLTIDDIEQNPAYNGSGLSVYSIAITNRSPELKKFKTHEEIIQALSTLDYIYHIEELQL